MTLRVSPGVTGTVIGAQVFARKGVDKDERAQLIEEEEETYHFKGGLVEFVKYLDETRTALHKPVYIEGEKDDTPLEIAFEYSDAYSDNIHTYVNNINTHEGGTHLVGFKTALTRTLNAYAYKNNLIKKVSKGK